MPGWSEIGDSHPLGVFDEITAEVCSNFAVIQTKLTYRNAAQNFMSQRWRGGPLCSADRPWFCGRLFWNWMGDIKMRCTPNFYRRYQLSDRCGWHMNRSRTRNRKAIAKIRKLLPLNWNLFLRCLWLNGGELIVVITVDIGWLKLLFLQIVVLCV